MEEARDIAISWSSDLFLGKALPLFLRKWPTLSTYYLERSSYPKSSKPPQVHSMKRLMLRVSDTHYILYCLHESPDSEQWYGQGTYKLDVLSLISPWRSPCPGLHGLQLTSQTPGRGLMPDQAPHCLLWHCCALPKFLHVLSLKGYILETWLKHFKCLSYLP